jgi:hypothetical protein
MTPCQDWTGAVCQAWFAAPAFAAAAALLAFALTEAPPAAHRRHPRAGAAALAVAAGAFTAAGVLAGLAYALVAMLVLALALGLAASGAWTLRAAGGVGPGDDGGGGPDPPPEDGPPGGDWAAFERDFWSYVERQRAPVVA